MNKNYKKERIKLALLYIGIVLFIEILFSLILLRLENQQFRRFDRFREAPPIETHQMRLEREKLDSIIKQIKYENLRSVLLLDITLLLAASFFSYYLSGKTLEPILAALKKQKRFVSDASHELKTPLANMKVEAEVLNRSKKVTIEEYKEFTTNVISDINKLNDLVTFMLDAARSENQSSRVTMEEVDINKLTKTIAKEFTESAKTKSVTISVENPEKKLLITTDKKLLQRLLSILVDNALKYNVENGTITIKSYRNKSKLAVIEIKDSGIGIESADLPKIFDRFYRASEDRNEKGFGLGLSIAKQLAQDLNIEMEVKSKPRVGTTFKLVIG